MGAVTSVAVRGDHDGLWLNDELVMPRPVYQSHETRKRVMEQRPTFVVTFDPGAPGAAVAVANVEKRLSQHWDLELRSVTAPREDPF